tara:strand:- start:38 stop:724 length:687 start_codon:yes stop_codon:yes gene_type:complete
MTNIFKIIFFVSLALSIDEALLYDLNFRGFNAGESILSIKEDSTETGINYHLTSIIKTNKLLDRIYKIRDRVDVILNNTDYSLIKVVKKLNQGGKKTTFNSIINQENLTAVSNNKTISIPGKVLDPLGAIYYLRNQNIKIGDTFEFTTYDNDKLKDLIIIAKGIETISTSIGNVECIVLSPQTKDGKLLKNKGTMTLWISNDSKKIPIQIENRTNVGKMLMKLKNIKQ